MNQLAVIILEDEPEVRQAIERDLADFARTVRLWVSDDADDARAVVKEILDDGDYLALVLADHRLPGESGVDFLISLMADHDTRLARKVLVTGQADQADTIRALNEAELDHYIAKPWQAAELQEVVRRELTEFVDLARLNPLPYLDVLDQVAAMELVRRRATD